MTAPRPIPVALTIAGSDSGGGAGIQADLKTFTVLGVYGMSALTAVTVQNTVEVRQAEALAPELVAAQMDAVLEDIGCDAAKTGMLANAGIIEAVAGCLLAHGVDRLVVDPVMVSKSGHALLAPEAREALTRHILPLALVVTPNLHEAGVLTGQEVASLEDMRRAAREIAAQGPRAVVVKGGHLADDPVDLLYLAPEEEEILLREERMDTPHTHGTGCTFSAAIAAYLASGDDLPGAVRGAKRFITHAIRHSLALGSGHGPTHHMAAGRLVERS